MRACRRRDPSAWNDMCKACMMCAEFDGAATPASRSAGVIVAGNRLRINNRVSSAAVLEDAGARARDACLPRSGFANFAGVGVGAKTRQTAAGAAAGAAYLKAGTSTSMHTPQ